MPSTTSRRSGLASRAPRALGPDAGWRRARAPCAGRADPAPGAAPTGPSCPTSGRRRPPAGRRRPHGRPRASRRSARCRGRRSRRRRRRAPRSRSRPAARAARRRRRRSPGRCRRRAAGRCARSWGGHRTRRAHRPSHPAAELPRSVAGEDGVLERPRRRGSAQPQQRSDLAEVVGRAHGGQHVLAAVDPPAEDLDRSLLDDVDEVGLVALLEQDRARGQLDAANGRDAARPGRRRARRRGRPAA